MSKESIFLMVAAVGLMPIALAYGLVPATTVPMLYGVEIDSINLTHIFRAVMGLYLAMIVFCHRQIGCMPDHRAQNHEDDRFHSCVTP